MLVAAVALALVDCWQVALRAPGSLGPSAVAWLLALYVATTGAGALVLQGLLRRSRATTRAALLAAGGALFAMEGGLRALEPLSPWRPAVVAGAVLLGVVAFLALRPLCARRVPAWLAGLALGALALGAFLATASPTGALAEPAAASRALPASARREHPSFLVVVIDTLRADHLGAYGYARPTSPVLDQLARDGVLFERAFAQSSWTKPSVASLFTGRFPSQHGTVYESSKLPATERTLPEILRAGGYRTAVLSGNPWVTPEYGFDQGVDDFYSVYDERFTRVTLYMTVLKRVAPARAYNRVKYLVLGELSTTARDTAVVDEAERWLAAYGDRPFFLYLHLMSPHHPYDPPPPFDRFVPDRTHPPVKNYPRKSYFFFERGDPLPEADLADMLARYDGDVLYADTEVGRLLAALDRLGLETTTTVVVTADHGEEFYDHGNWGHGQSLYNELIRVPLIVRLPGRLPANTRSTRVVMHVDLLPTLAELAGVSLGGNLAPPGMLANGLLHALRLESAGRSDEAGALSQLVYRYGEANALVQGDEKLITMRRGKDERREGFDLATDFAEERPLPATASRLQPLLQFYGEVLAAVEAQRSPAEDTEATDRERLRALGYTE